MTGVTDWLGNTTRFEYDGKGWPVRWGSPFGRLHRGEEHDVGVQTPSAG